jgi:hypothetical protein
LVTHVWFATVHWAVAQQLPATQWPPQQKSAAFAVQALFVLVHASETQSPVVVLQMWPAP